MRRINECEFNWAWKLLVIALAVLFMLVATDSKRLEKRIEKLENPPAQLEKKCEDYTIKESRDGVMPEKCGAELYGDQL